MNETYIMQQMSIYLYIELNKNCVKDSFYAKEKEWE